MRVHSSKIESNISHPTQENSGTLLEWTEHMDTTS